MNFYNLIFATTLIFTYLHEAGTDTNNELFFPESGLVKPFPLAIGLVFFVKINNTSDRNDYGVEITPDECCLRERDHLDCDSLQILGGCTDFIPKGETKTVKVIAPLLNQYEREGYCVIYVDSKSSNGQNKRDIIKINFDTTFRNNNFEFVDNFKRCKHKNEDPFNDCKPINCDTYYNAKRPYFSRKLKRCVAVPPCVKDDDYIYPSIIYNPITNQCYQESIINEDLDYIKNINNDNKKSRKSKDVLIINKVHPNNTEFLHKDILLDDIIDITTPKQVNTNFLKAAALNLKETMKQHKKANCLNVFFKKYFIDNKWTFMVLVLVVIVQCFLICTMVYCLSKTCICCEDKKVIRKFFNYRQDASVTTPLIDTSNMDTETTECQYLTESSNNINKKIKCYKACQKEQNNNAKNSMSDDILSKCLNRRDWRKLQSVDIVEYKNDVEIMKNITKSAQVDESLAKVEEIIIPSETKVMFEDEKTNTLEKRSKLANKNGNAKICDDEMKDNQEVKTNLSSEKEIKCYSYNGFDAGFRANLAKKINIFRSGTPKKDTISNSIEKGAQAYFSNDSIDDFLSERGATYLAGEHMSKYTFSSGSNDIKPSSSVSSKTSKNFVKNVLSLLHKRSKQGPSSDPGQNKDIDVKLIHMSRASVYSSTNDSDCLKTLKRKDSTTSF